SDLVGELLLGHPHHPAPVTHALADMDVHRMLHDNLQSSSIAHQASIVPSWRRPSDSRKKRSFRRGAGQQDSLTCYRTKTGNSHPIRKYMSARSPEDYVAICISFCKDALRKNVAFRNCPPASSAGMPRSAPLACERREPEDGMRAFGIEAFGETPALRALPRPEPGPGEVRVRIAACGLNFADLLMIDGRYQERTEPPLTLGMEVAGTVDALGPGVAGPAPGTRVAAFSGTGGLADYGCFPAARCLPIPDGMPFAHAAGFQIAYGTAHVALDHRAALRPGETLLVLGAAGGVGLTAVEVGKLLGARIIACARGADKLAAARAAGADHLIDSDTADLKAEI